MRLNKKMDSVLFDVSSAMREFNWVYDILANIKPHSVSKKCILSFSSTISTKLANLNKKKSDVSLANLALKL